jgi:photosystem II stability/assembly factor-like uncharacterized protein
MSRLILLFVLVVLLVPSAAAQRRARPQPAPAVRFDTTWYNGLAFRSIGPYRGGRSAAVAGVAGQPSTYYFGATGGGVWKTTDAGQTWHNVSDGFFGGSIGAVAVSASDPNVVYVGGGEVTVRGNVSHGYGMWRSTDAGKTWASLGLTDTRHIPRIAVHPTNPDLVYVAALGHLFGPNEERGVYRSKDGGQTWERILFVNNEVGTVDLHLDPTNPRVLYAATWRVLRTPYSLESGGEGSGLWKSTDGGDTWVELTRRKGLPQGTVGIIGVAVSPVNPDRVWAIIEATDGGVFRSDDGGQTWAKTNEHRNLRQRAWYYTRLYADPHNADQVYVLNVEFWRSKDGGRTFESIDTPHGDHHDLWISPDNARHMVIADDGGAQVTLDGGTNWSTYHNQPTAQFYRVTTDDVFPYRIYGAQQDNSTVRIPHRTTGFAIGERDWQETAGGESGWIAPDPKNPDVVYGGSYGGYLTRLDHRTGIERAINVWPDNPMGHGAADLRYRFQWNFPLLFSRHDPHTLYAAGNVLFKTTNEGQSWMALSPDLTRNDTTRMRPSGGPITKDNTSVEYYGTVFALAEGAEPGVIWTGSDDGLIHLTRDGGQTWQNVTPPATLLPEWAQINEIVAHPFEPGGAYVAATRYKSDDFRPYLFRTTDYGQTWTKVTDGIDPQHFTRTIQPDPVRRGLLFAGTESGLYISFDDGASWQPFQQNLPIVPITDLAWKDSDLIVATQGRSFWVLDDLTPLHQLTPALAARPMHLYAPRPAYRLPGGSAAAPGMGQNPPNGVVLHYYLKEQPDSNAVTLRLLEADGTLIRTFKPKDKDNRLPVRRGLNRFVWNLRYPDAERFDGLVLWGGGTQGPKAVPGSYQARLIVGTDSMTVPVVLHPDPRATTSMADLQAQFDFLIGIRDKLSETHRAIRQIRDVRQQVNALTGRLGDQTGADTIRTAATALLEQLKAVEEALYQTKNQSSQDPLNYPIRLNNRLSALVDDTAMGDFRPTDQAVQVRDEVTRLIDAEQVRLRALLETDLTAFNQLVQVHAIPAVIVKPE